MNEPKQVPEPSAERIGCNICGEALPDGEPHLCSEPQGEPSDAQVEAVAQSIHSTYQTDPTDRFTWDGTSETNRNYYRRMARRALRAAGGVR